MWPFLSLGGTSASVDPGIVGAGSGVVVRSWEPRDVVGYAVGIGADPDEGMPATWATVLCQHGVEFPESLGPWPPERVEHVEQSHQLESPLPARGVLSVRTSVSDVHDRRAGAVVGICAVAVDGAGQVVARTRMGLLVRDAFCGLPARAEPPAAVRAGGEVVVHRTRNDQAERYARCGDDNPMHVDGHGATVLHGLCTYGFVGRAVVAVVCPGRPERLTGLDLRLIAPVLAGDSLHTEVRATPDGAVFRTLTGRRTVAAAGTARLA
jgi:acyl dehydratase